MTSHPRCAKDSASCYTKFCLLREHRVLKNFVAAAVFSVGYFLNVVEVTVTKVSLAQSVSELHCN